MTESIVDFYEEQDPFFELSNFYRPSQPMIYDGKEYQTSEHLYQSKKFQGPLATPLTQKPALLTEALSTAF